MRCDVSLFRRTTDQSFKDDAHAFTQIILHLFLINIYCVIAIFLLHIFCPVLSSQNYGYCRRKEWILSICHNTQKSYFGGLAHESFLFSFHRQRRRFVNCWRGHKKIEFNDRLLRFVVVKCWCDVLFSYRKKRPQFDNRKKAALQIHRCAKHDIIIQVVYNT